MLIKRFLIPSTLVFFGALNLLAAQTATTVHVSAAASLKNALMEIAKGYPDAHVVTTFESSSVLAMQIKAGAPADLFISADEAKMDMLQKAGLIFPKSRRDILRNSLVVLASGKEPANLQNLSDLALDPKTKIAIGQPASVPAGIYAKAALTQAGVWDKVEHQLIPCENVRAALAAVESGNAQYAIVYKSDATIAPQCRVVYEIPESDSGKVRYPVALVKSPGSTDPSLDSVQFEEYLSSPAASAIFKKYGFRTSGSDD